jgi:hypothetical protein
MKRRATNTTAADSQHSHDISDKCRRPPHAAAQPPRELQRPGSSATDAEAVYAQTMRRLRVYIRLLSALVLASLARAVIDGLTTGLVLVLALTTLLLLASLRLWRVGSQHKPNDAAPPGLER